MLTMNPISFLDRPVVGPRPRRGRKRCAERDGVDRTRSVPIYARRSPATPGDRRRGVTAQSAASNAR